MITKYTKKDGSTCYQFQAYLYTDEATGKQVRTTRRGFKTYKDAKKELVKLKHQALTKSVQLKQNTYTFETVFNIFFELHKLTIREQTQRSMLLTYKKHLAPHFSNLKVNKINTAYCQKVVNAWHKSTYKHTQLLYTFLNQVLNFAVKMDMITVNPFDKVIKPKRERATKNIDDIFYTKDELKTFLSFFKDDIKYYAIFRTLAYTGLRIGELLALHWSDIDFNNKLITVNKTAILNTNGKMVVNPPKTKTSNRVVAIDDVTLNVLKQWQKQHKKEIFAFGKRVKNKNVVFYSTTNNYMRAASILKKMNAVVNMNNFKRITLHGLRHTHCSLLLESGAPLQVVQQRLGHNDIKITMQIYTHITQKQQQDTAQNFLNYMQK